MWQRLRSSLAGGLAVAMVLLWTVAAAGAPVAAQGYTYGGTWQGQTVSLTHVANVTVEGLPDATQVGQLGNFQTNDPSYTCLDGESINVWTAPKEFPGDYVVHNGNQGSQCTYGTWTFPQQAAKQSLTLNLTASPNPVTVGGTTTVTATLSQPVSDGSIEFTLMVGGSGHGVGSCTPTNGSCSPPAIAIAYDQSFTVDATWTGDATYDAASASTQVTVQPAQQSVTLTVVASPNPVASGQGTTVTVTLSQPVSDGNVSIMPHPSSGVSGGYTVGSCPLADGTCSVSGGSYQGSGSVTFDVTWSGDSQYGPASGSTMITVTGAPAQPDSVAVTASPSSLPADGASTATITATVTNAGQPVTGDTVQFEPACGSVSPTGVATDGQGQATTTYTACTTPGTYSVVATETASGAQGAASVTLTAPPPTGAATTVTLSAAPGSVPADGSTASSLTATVQTCLRSLCQPDAGVTVAFSATAGQLAAPSAVTDGSGQATDGITATQAGSATVTATASVGGQAVSGDTLVSFTAPTSAANQVSVSTSPSSLPADGNSTAAVTATVTTPGGAPVPGDYVIFSAGCGSITHSSNASGAATNAQGQATATYTACTTPGSATVSALEDQGGTGSATIQLGTPSASAWPYTATVTSFSGSGLTQGTTYDLIPLNNITLEDVASGGPAGQATLTVGATASPYQCLNGQSINIFQLQGQYFLHDGLQGSMCTYGTWEFAPSSVTSPLQVPAISGVSPDPAAPGATVTVSGSNFGSNPTGNEAVLLIQETSTSSGPLTGAGVSAWTPTSVTALLPAGLAAGSYTVLLLTEQGAAATTLVDVGSAGTCAVASYQVTAPSRVRAGVPFGVHVVALDAAGNPVTCATGPVYLASGTHDVLFANSSFTRKGPTSQEIPLRDGSVTVVARDMLPQTVRVSVGDGRGHHGRSNLITVAAYPSHLKLGLFSGLQTPGSFTGTPDKTLHPANVQFLDYNDGVLTGSDAGGFWPLGVGTPYSAWWQGTIYIPALFLHWPPNLPLPQHIYRFRNVADDAGWAQLSAVAGTGASITLVSSGKQVSSVVIPTSSWQQGNHAGVAVRLTPGQYGVDVQQTEQDGQGGAGDILYWSQGRLVGPPPCTAKICPMVVIAPHLVWSPYAPVPPAAFVPHAQPLLLHGVVLTIGDPHEQLGGVAVTGAAAPVIVDGRTMVPLRVLGQILGATVHWVGPKKQIVVVLGGHTVVMTLGSKTYTIDGDPHEMDAAPFIMPPGLTMVPLTFVAQGLGLQVGWIAQTQQVVVETPGGSTPVAPVGTLESGDPHESGAQG